MNFDKVEKIRMKYFSGVWVTTLAIILFITYCTGCASMPLYRHVQLTEETRINLDLIAGIIADKVNDGTIKEDNADIIIEIYNEVADTQHLYVNAVKAFRKGTVGQADVDARFSDLSLVASDLAANLMIYGVNIYKFTERIK